MRRTLLAAVALLTVLAWNLSAPAQQGGPPPTLHLNPEDVRRQLSSRVELVDVNNETTLVKYVQAFKAATTPDDQSQLVQELTDYLLQHGLSPSPDAAEAFLSLAIEARRAGRPEEFARLAGYAQSFDPGHPAIHMALASEARERQGTLSLTFLYESLAALLDSFTDVAWKPTSLANLALWTRAASLLLLAVLALLLFLRYNALLRHDVQEWLGSTEAAWTRAASWLVLFLPALLLLSGYWWVVYWGALFLIYSRALERLAVLLAVACLAASGWFGLWAQQQLYLSQVQPHASNLRCLANRMDVGPDRSLEEAAEGDANLKGTYLVILADRLLLQGSYVRAEKLYTEADRNQGGSAPACNNLGCLYYYQGRFQEAIAQFGRAIELRPDLGAAFFNRALAKNKLFDFSGAKEDQDKARTLDAPLFARLGKIQSEDWVPVPVFVPLEKTRTLALAQSLQKPTGLTRALAGKVTPATGILSPPFSTPAIVLALGFLLGALIRRRAFFSHACYKCGRPYCDRCKTSLEFESFCGQCVHLYIKQDGVSPEARLKKNYEVETHNRGQNIFRSVLSLVAPGAGHIWEGRALQGLLILALWCALLAGFLTAPWFYPLPAPPSAGSLAPAYTLAASAIMAVVWLVFGLLKALSRPAPVWDGRGRR